MDITFCDLCFESIPNSKLSEARDIRGRTVCNRCLSTRPVAPKEGSRRPPFRAKTHRPPREQPSGNLTRALWLSAVALTGLLTVLFLSRGESGSSAPGGTTDSSTSGPENDVVEPQLAGPSAQSSGPAEPTMSAQVAAQETAESSRVQEAPVEPIAVAAEGVLAEADASAPWFAFAQDTRRVLRLDLPFLELHTLPFVAMVLGSPGGGSPWETALRDEVEARSLRSKLIAAGIEETFLFQSASGASTVACRALDPPRLESLVRALDAGGHQDLLQGQPPVRRAGWTLFGAPPSANALLSLPLREALGEALETMRKRQRSDAPLLCFSFGVDKEEAMEAALGTILTGSSELASAQAAALFSLIQLNANSPPDTTRWFWFEAQEQALAFQRQVQRLTERSGGWFGFDAGTSSLALDCAVKGRAAVLSVPVLGLVRAFSPGQLVVPDTAFPPPEDKLWCLRLGAVRGRVMGFDVLDRVETLRVRTAGGAAARGQPKRVDGLETLVFELPLEGVAGGLELEIDRRGRAQIHTEIKTPLALEALDAAASPRAVLLLVGADDDRCLSLAGTLERLDDSIDAWRKEERRLGQTLTGYARNDASQERKDRIAAWHEAQGRVKWFEGVRKQCVATMEKLMREDPLARMIGPSGVDAWLERSQAGPRRRDHPFSGVWCSSDALGYSVYSSPSGQVIGWYNAGIFHGTATDRSLTFEWHQVDGANGRGTWTLSKDGLEGTLERSRSKAPDLVVPRDDQAFLPSAESHLTRMDTEPLEGFVSDQDAPLIGKWKNAQESRKEYLVRRAGGRLDFRIDGQSHAAWAAGRRLVFLAEKGAALAEVGEKGLRVSGRSLTTGLGWSYTLTRVP